MKKTIITLVLSYILVISIMEAKCQNPYLVTLKQPPPGKLNVEDFWEVTVTNNSDSTRSVYMTGTATESKDGLIAKGKTVPFMLKGKGVNNIKIKDLPKTPDIEYTASDPRYKESLIRTGDFPSGQYEICVKVVDARTNQELGSDCFNQDITGSGLISLINPSDGYEMEANSPLTFTWSSVGKPPASGYILKIVEVIKEQSNETAMKNNPAFFEQKGIKTTTFTYPTSAKGFEEGKKYAWVVMSGSNSETNDFTIRGVMTGLIEVTVNGIQGDQTINKCNFVFSAYHMGAQPGTNIYHLKILDASANSLTCPVDASVCTIPPVMEFASTTGSITVNYNNTNGSADDGSGNTYTGLTKLVPGRRYVVIFCKDGSPGFGWSNNTSSSYNWCSSFLFQGCPLLPKPPEKDPGLDPRPIQTDKCIDFENGSNSEWQVSVATLNIIEKGGNPGAFLQTTDAVNSPSFLYNDSTFSGNWFDNLGPDSCGAFCFDMNYLYAGDGNTTQLTLIPNIYITDGTNAFRFFWNPIQVGSGWQQFCAPIAPLTPDGLLPFSNAGYWTPQPGTSQFSWNSTLQNITRVSFPVDPTSYQNERIGYDNICLKSEGECNRCDNEAVPCFTMKDTVCLKDPITIDASCSEKETSYFLSIQESDANWGRYGVEETQWFTGTAPNLIDIKSWFTSRGRTWQCDKYYRVIIVVKNLCTQWKGTAKLLYIDCCKPGCNCGKWEQDPIISYRDDRKTFEKKIKCFDKSVYGPAKVGSPVTFHSNYICSQSCIPSYNWTLLNSSGSVVTSGTSNLMPISVNAPSPAGQYKLLVKALCDEKVCDSCEFNFTTQVCFSAVTQVPKQYTICTITPTNITSTSFNVTATQPSITFSNNCGYYWEVCELDANNNIIQGTLIGNPSQWWTYPSTTFPGYNGTSNLVGSAPGVFDLNKKYRITYGVWCECMDWNQNSWIYDPSIRSGINFIEDNSYQITTEMKKRIREFQPEQK